MCANVPSDPQAPRISLALALTALCLIPLPLRAAEPDIFFDDFESGSVCRWSRTVSGIVVTGIRPTEGSVGTRIDIEYEGAGDFTPQVVLSTAGSPWVALEVLESQPGRVAVRLDQALAPGRYAVSLVQCASATTGAYFEVRLPADLHVDPAFARVRTPAVLTGSFFGSQVGQIAVRPAEDPSTEHEAEILSWEAGVSGSPDRVEFLIPNGLSVNGHYDVRITNGVGTAVAAGATVVFGADDGDTTGPQVVNAVAVSNTEVLVQFSEAVEGGAAGAENPAHYRITSPATKVSTLGVLGAEVLRPSLSTVKLRTISQNDLLYELTATNVRDLAGNPITAPSETAFVGIPPSGGPAVDSDGDGLSDAEEQTGWNVHVRRLDGSVEKRHVTSDPGDPRLEVDDPINVAARDTDGDGLQDDDEKSGGTDPRASDTDSDRLPDAQEGSVVPSDATDQDSDEDRLDDGFEFLTLRTSPVLADTDGDQLSDHEEFLSGNRDPLVADLPAPRVNVGNVSLQLDTVFEFTSETGEQTMETRESAVDLRRSENDELSTSDERSTSKTLEFSEEISASVDISAPPGGSIGASFGSSQGSEQGSSFTVGETTGRESEEAYHDSLTTSRAVDVRESVTRRVDGAAVKVTVTLENTNDIPFTISNLELTAQTQDPTNRRRLIPLASLVPENDGLEEVNIGALGDPERGPFVFHAVSVFPKQVEELLKSPQGLVVSLANFDISDEEGRNFAFVSREVLDRTAGIVFDLGDGRVERYRVATAGAHDPVTGRPRGITLRYALREILGLSDADYETRPLLGNAVLDGGDGIADTAAEGDDRQEVAVGDPVRGVRGPGAASCEPSQAPSATTSNVIVTAGPNGVLDTTTISGDDLRAQDRGAFLTRFRDVATGLVDDPSTPLLDETRRFWMLFSSKDLSPNVALDDIVLQAGDELNFAYVQDQDLDGVVAREEFLHGSRDSLENTDACPMGAPDCSGDPVEGRLEPPEYDLLSDSDEIQKGWCVQIKGEPQADRVYPNPTQGDSDRDRLADHEERACALDPRRRDTDLDGLTDWEELTGQQIVDGVVVVMQSRNPLTDDGPVIEVYTGSGPLGLVDHDPNPDCDDALGHAGFATDPLDPDTDRDMVSDFVELRLGLHPNDRTDGGDFLDDDGDGISNNDERLGYDAGVNCGSAAPAICQQKLDSNPNDPDSDDDGLPDLLERFLGSDPRRSDTDGDGLTDVNEYKGGGEACVTVVKGKPCRLFRSLVQDDFATFVRECDAADSCVYDEDAILAGRDRFGTNLNERDTDFDGRDDPAELNDDLPITVNGAPDVVMAPASDALRPDTDGDGILDGEEAMAGMDGFVTNPSENDTDADGKSDFFEVGTVDTDPTFRDRRVTVTSDFFTITLVDEEFAEGDLPFVTLLWAAGIRVNGGNETFVCGVLDEPIPGEGVFFKSCHYFSGVIREGEPGVTIGMLGREVDFVTADDVCNVVTETFDFDNLGNRTVTFDCSPSDPDLSFQIDLDIAVDQPSP